MKRYTVHIRGGTALTYWAKSAEQAARAAKLEGHNVVSVELAP